MTISEELSSSAQQIFERIKVFFPPDFRKQPRWKKEGKVFANGCWFDLWEAEDRKLLKENTQKRIGSLVECSARAYQEKTGFLQGFTGQCYSKEMEIHVGLLFLLDDFSTRVDMDEDN